MATSRVSAVSEISASVGISSVWLSPSFAAQSGRKSSLKMLKLLSDEQLIADARREAAALLAADPELRGHPALRAEIDRLLTAERAVYLETG